jgi:hypothetical protein
MPSRLCRVSSQNGGHSTGTLNQLVIYGTYTLTNVNLFYEAGSKHLKSG